MPQTFAFFALLRAFRDSTTKRSKTYHGSKMVALGFPMLTLGIVSGALWAQQAWGAYWHWDPKETWSLITWLIYAAYLHVRLAQGWRGKWANRLLIIGFTSILITYLGVNSLSTGLHKYNW